MKSLKEGTKPIYGAAQTIHEGVKTQAATQNHLTHLEHEFRESEEARKKYEQNVERE